MMRHICSKAYGRCWPGSKKIAKDKYCESFGHVCYQAAEEVDENCDFAATVLSMST